MVILCLATKPYSSASSSPLAGSCLLHHTQKVFTAGSLHTAAAEWGHMKRASDTNMTIHPTTQPGQYFEWAPLCLEGKVSCRAFCKALILLNDILTIFLTMYEQWYVKSHINWLFKEQNASSTVIFHCDTYYLHGWKSIAPRNAGN